MKIEDLVPQRATFKLKKFKDVEFVLRPINFRDRAWIKNSFGEEPEKLLAVFDFEIASKIAYHQLELEFKKMFPATTIKDIDDEGEEKEIRYTGPQMFSEAIETMVEAMDIIKAIVQTIGISAPLFDELMEKDLKKKEPLLKKSTTENCGTPLQVNTDTPLNNS